MKTQDFALAPSGATHIYPDTAMKPSIPIPLREIELNRWADTYETWTDVTLNERLIVNAPAITENMFNERRRQRLEAGLISEDHGSSSEIPNSSDAQGNCPEIPEGSEQPSYDWLPEVGKGFEATVVGKWYSYSNCKFIGSNHIIANDECGNEVVIRHDIRGIKFRPIETDQQKAERERDELKARLAKNLRFDHHGMTITEPNDYMVLAESCLGCIEGQGYRLIKEGE